MFKAQFSEGKEKTTKFCNISDNGYLDWLFLPERFSSKGVKFYTVWQRQSSFDSNSSDIINKLKRLFIFFLN